MRGQEVADDVGTGHEHDVVTNAVRADTIAAQHQRRRPQERIEGGRGQRQQGHVQHEAPVLEELRIGSQHGGQPVSLGLPGWLVRRQPAPGRHPQHGRQRGHQHEVGLPAQAHVQLATHDGAQGWAQAHGHADIGHHARALRALEEVLDQGATDHHARGTAGALQHARQNQRGQIGGQGREDRCQQGDAQAGHQDLAPAQTVGQRAVDQLQQTIGQDIAAESQLHGGLGGTEDGGPFLHGGQTDGHGQQAERQLREQVGDQPTVVGGTGNGRGHAVFRGGRGLSPRTGQYLSMEVPALRCQATQQGGEVLQTASDQVADVAIALPDTMDRHQA